MTIAYLSLGSNKGNRLSYLRRALHKLSQEKGIEIKAVSSIYETYPVGFHQRRYLNGAVEIETFYTPQVLIARIKHIEKLLGRQPSPPWGPRCIDIDIILYGDTCLKTKTLQIPHPQFRFRRFVLTPLAELNPFLKDPERQRPVSQLLAELTSPHQKVRLYASKLIRP